MELKIDRELCIGCGACESICPDAFELVDDKSSVQLNTVPEVLFESA